MNEQSRIITESQWKEYQDLLKIVSAMNQSLIDAEDYISKGHAFGEHPGTTLSAVETAFLLYRSVAKNINFDKEKYGYDELVRQGVLKK